MMKIAFDYLLAERFRHRMVGVVTDAPDGRKFLVFTNLGRTAHGVFLDPKRILENTLREPGCDALYADPIDPVQLKGFPCDATGHAPDCMHARPADPGGRIAGERDG